MISDSVFEHSQAGSQGGAIRLETSVAEVVNVDCAHNHVLGNETLQPGSMGSGGCLAAADSTLLWSHVRLQGNSAPRGGAAAFQCPTNILSSSTELEAYNNTAAQAGGAVFWDGCSGRSLPLILTPQSLSHNHGPKQSPGAVGTTAAALRITQLQDFVLSGVVTQSNSIATAVLEDAIGQPLWYDNSTVCRVSHMEPVNATGVSVVPLHNHTYRVVSGAVSLQPFGVQAKGADAIEVTLTCGSALTARFAIAVRPVPVVKWSPGSQSGTALPSGSAATYPLRPPPAVQITTHLSLSELSPTCYVSVGDSAAFLVGNTTASLANGGVITTSAGVIEAFFPGIGIRSRVWSFDFSLSVSCSFGGGEVFVVATGYIARLTPVTLHWQQSIPSTILPSSPLLPVPLQPYPCIHLAAEGTILPVQTSCRIQSLTKTVDLFGTMQATSLTNTSTICFESLSIFRKEGLPLHSNETFGVEVTCTWLDAAEVVLRHEGIHIPSVSMSTTPSREALIPALPNSAIGATLRTVMPELSAAVDPQLRSQHVTCTVNAASPDDGATLTFLSLQPPSFDATSSSVSIAPSTSISLPRWNITTVHVHLQCKFRTVYDLPSATWTLVMVPLQLEWAIMPPDLVLPSSRDQLIGFTLSLTAGVVSNTSSSISNTSAIIGDGSCQVTVQHLRGELAGPAVEVLGSTASSMIAAKATFPEVGIAAPLDSQLLFLAQCQRRIGGPPLLLQRHIAVPDLAVIIDQAPPHRLPPQRPFTISALIVSIKAPHFVPTAPVRCVVLTNSTAVSVINPIATASNGTLLWEEVKVLGRLRTPLLLTLSCDISDVPVPAPRPFAVEIEDCQGGSEPDPSMTGCLACPEGKYSDGGTNQCIACPTAGADCNLGQLSLLNGYFPSSSAVVHGKWPSTSTPLLYQCPNPNACLVHESNRTFHCAEGFMGPFCGVCDSDEGFAPDGHASCSKCWPTWANVLITILGCMIGFALLVYVTLFQKHKQATASSIVLRMLLTYLQLLNSLAR